MVDGSAVTTLNGITFFDKNMRRVLGSDALFYKQETYEFSWFFGLKCQHMPYPLFLNWKLF